MGNRQKAVVKLVDLYNALQVWNSNSTDKDNETERKIRFVL